MSDGSVEEVKPRVFTLEVDGRPILAFEAARISEAKQICKETWLLNDLIVLKSGGVPLRTAQSKLSVRPATSEEITIFEQAAPEPSDEMVLAFLVELDVARRGRHENDRRIP
jgi:alcohol dehydrogenase class IV